jgi:hypothetical protein
MRAEEWFAAAMAVSLDLGLGAPATVLASRLEE